MSIQGEMKQLFIGDPKRGEKNTEAKPCEINKIFKFLAPPFCSTPDSSSSSEQIITFKYTVEGPFWLWLKDPYWVWFSPMSPTFQMYEKLWITKSCIIFCHYTLFYFLNHLQHLPHRWSLFWRFQATNTSNLRKHSKSVLFPAIVYPHCSDPF